MTSRGLLKVINLDGGPGIVFDGMELTKSILLNKYFFSSSISFYTGQISASLSALTGFYDPATGVYGTGRIFTKHELITYLHKNKLLK